ncbi:hypothetical protein GCM10010923_06170 [Blastomonas marina]|uniref:MarR family transcriptional regulator n=1 Tax=Blastomonas marina TaxID=1867408 RepID=A0ABQ1F622_9SPHN|nr:hypothetical protein GCM10010923_06170 [Blastomonas marina]
MAELRHQARQMSRHAWSLLRMADSLAREEVAQNDLADPSTASALAYEHEQLLAAMAGRLLDERARRRKLFPNRMFDEAGWDMLMILYRNRVQGRRSLPHNVAMEIETTVRVVEDLAKELISDGLVEWCSRFHFIRLSDEGAARIRDFFLDEDRAPEAGESAVPERKCA